MAHRGPDPRGEGGESWTYVEDRPHRRKPLVDLPEHRGTAFDAETGVSIDVPWNDATLSWWKVVRALPHAALWTIGDWAFAVASARVADVAFTDGTTSAFTELRRREDAMGLTSEARRKLRIKFVSRDELDAITGAPSHSRKKDTTEHVPIQIEDERRKRALG